MEHNFIFPGFLKTWRNSFYNQDRYDCVSGELIYNSGISAVQRKQKNVHVDLTDIFDIENDFSLLQLVFLFNE